MQDIATIPSKTTKEDSYYWDDTTNKAILAYNNSTCSLERNAIYEEHLHIPFTKLIYGYSSCHTFAYINENIEDVQKDALSYLVTKLHNIKTDGNLFNYCTILIKWYLINRNMNSNKDNNTTVTMDDESNNLAEILDSGLDYYKILESKEFTSLAIAWFKDNIPILFPVSERKQYIAHQLLDLVCNDTYLTEWKPFTVESILHDIGMANNVNNCSYVTRIRRTMRDKLKELAKQYAKSGQVTVLQPIMQTWDQMVDVTWDQLLPTNIK